MGSDLILISKEVLFGRLKVFITFHAPERI